MIYGFNRVHSNDDELGALTSELHVRVLNGSAAGCLVESTRPLSVGLEAGLRVSILGCEYDDDVRVMRCQPIVGAPGIYHIAVQFLSTTPPYAGSLRYAIYRELGQFAGWLHASGAADSQSKDPSRRRTADATEE
jgi:hypothetical protein